ncbi:iron chaperone [Pseudoxanthomonas dokdonensis]|uniref:YdhG-like domain-containing protein n=1 Tax=Pseudoxanthomonas dokdonensis TaxID=344882 RepID=A0A0R0CU48_9GAMM|nr:DUF1801 domain-containing protein [Pseudoxanthomonas dokdonensis]KRG69986.1 hypothetical protein ABB29_07010 [Pseudoxanthomonas dokdonensis]
MSGKRPATVDEYIRNAPDAAQPHLRRLRAILRKVAPAAIETLKWNTPFFVEPRFLFSYSAHKAHLSFAAGADAMQAFADELAQQQTTTHFLKVGYDQPLPEDLIRRMAEYQLQQVSQRSSDSFW